MLKTCKITPPTEEFQVTHRHPGPAGFSSSPFGCFSNTSGSNIYPYINIDTFVEYKTKIYLSSPLEFFVAFLMHLNIASPLYCAKIGYLYTAMLQNADTPTLFQWDV